MSNPASSSAALPIAYVVLRILTVLNWLGGAAILALLVVLPNRQWIMSALELSPSPEAERLVMGLRAIAVKLDDLLRSAYDAESADRPAALVDRRRMHLVSGHTQIQQGE